MNQDPQREERQEQYNRFGRWVRALNGILETTLDEVSQMIGYNKGSFSVATRGDGSMSRQTFNDLLQAYHALAITRSVRLPVTWQLFLALAWVGEDTDNSDLSVIKGAEESLEHVEWLAEVMKRQRQLRKEHERLITWRYKRDALATVKQLEREKEELELKVAWLEAQLKQRERW